MKSKWEWIAEKLDELGLVDLAAKAREIETVLKCLYGNTVTELWEDVIDEVEKEYNWVSGRGGKLGVVEYVATGAGFCKACWEHEDCTECRFAEVAGVCQDSDSLFGRFYDLLEEAMLSG